MKHLKFWMVIGLLCCLLPVQAQTAIHDLLNRIGGPGTADRFVVAVDPSVAKNGRETFVITAQNGKPCIKGSTTLAVTTGINWYLNHYARVNLTWNNLTTNLSGMNLPVPSQPEERSCNADYRYYLNYCTFSYSMSTWTWERWQQEIDWMALHGINMPLQIVGLDVVWKNLLTKDLGYTEIEANEFVAGPCFQAWWGMNNLEGWGGPNPQWWYSRQEMLAKNILKRQRELGMQPVLPGYSGMVPHNITSKKGYPANNQGNWCNFLRPYILNPNSQAFAEISKLYYKRLEEVMGTSEYYSMDPFHEGANTNGIDVPSAYRKIAEAMTTANPKSKWVIQYWQWNGNQYNVLNQVEKGKLIVLDLFSDAHTHFGEYQGHDAVYCALPNFGGRTGLFGRLSKIMTHYYEQKAQFNNIKGIGATPEAIEQTPVIYDALFELAWRDQAPDAKTWVKDYTLSRYGTESALAQEAWEQVRNTALNCETGLQGPHEAVLCARPALQVNSVSSWGGADIFYDAQQLADAAYKLLNAQSELSGKNYSYDLTDFSRQALTDYGNFLLKAIKQAHDSGDTKAYAQRRDAYLKLILDLDELLNTNENFMVGRWTKMARAIADEATGTTVDDRNWLELNNARTLITTWGDRNQSEGGGLRDYSYREWGGMMKDFYYNRWKTFFNCLDTNQNQPDWFQKDWIWAHDAKLQYNDQPQGNTAAVAAKLFSKYFINFKLNNGQVFHAYRCIENDARTNIQAETLRGKDYTFPVTGLPEGTAVTVGIDFNNDNAISADEQKRGLTLNVPADAVASNVLAQVSLEDGTVLKFKIILKDEIKEARTVSVKSANAAEGKAEIAGTNESSVTNKETVTIKATPQPGYNFTNWTDEKGNVVSSENPYTYLGAAAATFTANFNKDKWGSPEEDTSEWGDIQRTDQYLNSIKVTQNGGEEVSLYTENTCPKNLFHTTQMFNAAKGSEFKLHWNSNGMQYARLSAYIDLNADGDFDDPNEFLKVDGKKSEASNGHLNDYVLTVLLPYEMPDGITHLRLRFDGAWQLGNLNQYDAVPAKARTMRMVYDVPVNISNKAATACTVTVKSEDTQRGTVDANGQPDTYTYRVGEEVVLRCYPVKGYYLKCWTDRHGRTVPKSWMNGNNIRFHAPESGTYTAHFTTINPDNESQVSVADWDFKVQEQGNGIKLTQLVNAGNSALDLTQSKAKIVAVDANVFKNQKSLKEITFPASLFELDNLIYQTSIAGTGEKQTVQPTQTISGNTPWMLCMNIKNNDQSYNQWGSALIATGDNPFGDSYPNGFQLYLQSATNNNNLIVKVDNSNDQNSFANVDGNFDLAIYYDGKENLNVTLTRADGKSETLQIKQKLNDINKLSYGLPKGIALTNVSFLKPGFNGNPFEGCTALCKINVEKGNPLFSDRNGILFNAQGNSLLTYPEGRLFTQAYTLKNKATGQYISSNPPADKDGNIYATGGNGNERYATTDKQISSASLWNFANVKGKTELYHFNSKGYMGGKSDNGGVGQILEVLSNPEWAGDYDITWEKPFDQTLTATISLKQKNHNLKLASKENYLKFVEGSSNNDEVKWELTEAETMQASVSDKGWTSICFPVNAVVPAQENATVYRAEKMDNGILMLQPLEAGKVFAAGEGLLLKSNPNTAVTFNLATLDNAQETGTNILKGSMARRSGYSGFYTLGYDKKGLNAGLALSADAQTPVNGIFFLSDNNAKPSFIGLGNTDYKITIDEYDYMSLYLNYPVSIPEGVTAYTVNSIKNNELILQEIASSNRILAKNTPVLIYADIPEKASQTYTFKYSTEPGESSEQPYLKGTLTDRFVAPSNGTAAYVMAIHNHELKMMRAKLNLNAAGEPGTTHFKNRANKVYLEIPLNLSQNIQLFNLNRDNSSTGIEEIESEKVQTIYDIQGRRVLRITSPGVYIVNGKKQIVKY